MREPNLKTIEEIRSFNYNVCCCKYCVNLTEPWECFCTAHYVLGSINKWNLLLLEWEKTNIELRELRITQSSVPF